MGKYCDSRCVNAVSAECRCRCGGVNHGVGMELGLPVKVEPKPVNPMLIDPIMLAESMAIADRIISKYIGVGGAL